jgi:3'-5' exoribonuclease
MQELRVAELTPGSRVEGHFLVVRKDLRNGANAGRYLDCTLCDITGRRVPARVWDKAEEIAAQFAVGDVVLVKGLATSYRGELQIQVKAVQREEGADATRFLPRSAKDPAELERRLDEVIASVSNPFLSELLGRLFGEEDFRRLFFTAPGAKALHHAYIAGLAEHTVEVVAICERVAEVFPQLDRELLLAAAVLHDIGKIEELSWSAAFDYTDAGGLVGHIVLGEQRVSREVEQIEGFPPDLKLRLSHMILSHHGTREFGSPVEPATAEAIALHHAEDLGAKVNLFLSHINAGREQGKRWTERHFLLGRQLYVGPGEEGGEEA